LTLNNHNLEKVTEGHSNWYHLKLSCRGETAQRFLS